MEKIFEVQRKILTQPDARKAFAADPRGFLTKEGLKIPEGITLPKSIPLAEFEKRIAQVDQQLKAKGVDTNNMNAEQLQKANLMNMNEVQRLGNQPVTEETVAVVVAVVAVGVGVWSAL